MIASFIDIIALIIKKINTNTDFFNNMLNIIFTD